MMILYALYAAIYQIGLNGLMAAWLGSLDLPSGTTPPPTIIEAPIAVYAALVVVGLVLGLYLSLVIIRTFVAGVTRTIPRWAFTRRPLWGMLNIFVAGVVFSLLLVIGFMLLVIPGVIVYVAFIFTVIFIADNDVNFVTGFKRSWQLSRGNWLRIIIVLLIVVGLSTLLAGLVSILLTYGAVAAGLGRGLIGLGTLLLFAPITIYIFAVIIEMYNQLRAEESVDGDTMERL